MPVITRQPILLVNTRHQPAIYARDFSSPFKNTKQEKVIPDETVEVHVDASVHVILTSSHQNLITGAINTCCLGILDRYPDIGSFAALPCNSK